MVLPADQVGQAGGDRLMHQQVVQAVEQRAQYQDHQRHPGQLMAVQGEELATGRALREVDDAAEEAEQRHLDHGHDQPHQ
ncbi:hypothetical protein D9M68_800880 [compost metagenome]